MDHISNRGLRLRSTHPALADRCRLRRTCPLAGC